MQGQELEQVRNARSRFAAMATSYALGTFNDNFFKQATMLIAVAAGATAVQGYAAAAFTLPFVLLAAPAGWAADRFPKRRVVIVAKLTELLAAGVGVLGLLTGSLALMVGMVALMGVQSTFFSPALNGSIPELYPPSHVTRANAVLRMAVTVAILVGTAASGVVLDLSGPPLLGAPRGRAVLALSVVAIAMVGLAVSLGVPARKAADPSRRFPWTGPLDTWNELVVTFRDRLLRTVVLADVFVWSVGALQLLLVNPMGLAQFGLGARATSLLVAAQMVGIGLGGLGAARWAKGERWHRVIVPAGVAMAGLMGATALVPLLPVGAQVPALYALLALVGASGGLILIPCESFIQVRPAPERKGAVWAAANGAIFSGIVVASGVSNLLNRLLVPTLSFGILAVVALAFVVWIRRALAGPAQATDGEVRAADGIDPGLQP